VHRAVLLDVLGWAVAHGFEVLDLMRSPLLGPAGNVEFLAHIRPNSAGTPLPQELITHCIPASQTSGR
jgi:23S rRNA (cytidine1920-2'-O)/16S rRNA (cytidine1409-2'-O)-methyltransferase